MANKMSQNHLRAVVMKSKRYKLLDVYYQIIKDCYEITDGDTKKYGIFKQSESVYSISKDLYEKIPSIKSLTTVTTCFYDLIEMDILYYDEIRRCWIINEMEKMFEEGYVKLRNIVFDRPYHTLSVMEKRVFTGIILIMSSEKYKKPKSKKIQMNILQNSDFWNELLPSENKYYLKKIVASVIGKYFLDISEKEREKKTMCNPYINMSKYKTDKRKQKYLFVFEPKRITNSIVKKSNLFKNPNTDQNFHKNDPIARLTVKKKTSQIEIMKKQKRYSGEFKTEVVLGLLAETITVKEIATQYGVSPVDIIRWKNVFLERAPYMFRKIPSSYAEKLQGKDDQIANLERKVDKLVNAVDWMTYKLENF